MRVGVVGAGPAGLYLAILMKRADPRHEITVLERNPPDATFGWGVVFSEETLGELRDADYPTYLEITEAFARWNVVDIRYRGRVLRSRGHAFSAISRKVLLRILQDRARELGVELRFGEEVAAADALEGSDLLVGADGVNSTVRAWRQEAFGPQLEPHGARYVWFGTDLVLDAFTFIFRETGHGLLQVHAYPFDAGTSTFIVECPDETWRRAGLDGLDEQQTLAFCEELFAEELEGHRLLSNRSIWTSFINVRNRHWHDGNVVLLGDAAHTAHFSIGSGTKLAMEDSVALANAFVRHRDVPTALAAYELERQPVVERFQEAAGESARYFEHVARYARFEPIQFAFNLLTRSGRVGYANLTMRDPELVRALDSWFATGKSPDGTVRLSPPPMFAPLRLAGTTLANRVVTGFAGPDAGPDGMPTERGVERLARAAWTGAGLTVTGPVAVAPEGRITRRCPVLAEEAHVARWAELAERVRAAGALAGIQLGHAGRRGATESRARGVDLPLRDGAWGLIAASPLRYTPFSQVPAEMDAGDLQRVRDQFATSAALAAEAGFDALELNFAEGYLVAGFLSPLTNRRRDEHGGALEGRLRFPLAVLDAVRSAWPPERPLLVRLSATDCAAGGLTPADAVTIAAEIAAHGCHLIHVTAGQTTADGTPDYRRGHLTPLSDRIRTEAGVPTLVGGYITTSDEVNTIVGAGRADLCVLETHERREAAQPLAA